MIGQVLILSKITAITCHYIVVDIDNRVNICPAGGGPTGPNVVRQFVTPVQNRCPPSPDLCSATYYNSNDSL